jgi:hypothetical protein
LYFANETSAEEAKKSALQYVILQNLVRSPSPPIAEQKQEESGESIQKQGK